LKKDNCVAVLAVLPSGYRSHAVGKPTLTQMFISKETFAAALRVKRQGDALTPCTQWYAIGEARSVLFA
jgi:hypothetical protein